VKTYKYVKTYKDIKAMPCIVNIVICYLY